jgi:hypothetical protein
LAAGGLGRATAAGCGAGCAARTTGGGAARTTGVGARTTGGGRVTSARGTGAAGRSNTFAGAAARGGGAAGVARSVTFGDGAELAGLGGAVWNAGLGCAAGGVDRTGAGVTALAGWLGPAPPSGPVRRS